MTRIKSEVDSLQCPKCDNEDFNIGIPNQLPIQVIRKLGGRPESMVWIICSNCGISGAIVGDNVDILYIGELKSRYRKTD